MSSSMRRGEDMNKKMIAILFATLLLMGGVTSLLADESQESDENNYELTEPLTPDPSPTSSGIGNGGGNPG